MNDPIQATFACAVIAVLFGFFLWALCRVLDKNCDSIDFGYSPQEAEKQAKADKEVKQRRRLRIVRFWNL